METRIERIAGPGEVVRFAERLNEQIRGRLARMVRGARSSIIPLGEGSIARSLVLTSNSDTPPATSVVRSLMDQVQEAVSAMVQGTIDHLRDGYHLLPTVPKSTVPFVASLVVETAEVSRAILTFCCKRDRLDFVLGDMVTLLRSTAGLLEVAVKPHGGFRVLP